MTLQLSSDMTAQTQVPDATDLSLPLAAVASAALLAACGGGSGNDTTPTPTPAPTGPASALDAARFLAQASFGGTQQDVQDVQTQGFSTWLNSQLNMPVTDSSWDWMVAQGEAAVGRINMGSGIDRPMWRKLIADANPVRQRWVLALSEMFVISFDAASFGSWPQMTAAAYWDTLEANAFGNFRQLLNDVTLSYGMGQFLNLRGNQKADGKGREPDENYAREVMQLFTIGLTQLNLDGTPKLINGQPQDTYTPEDIRGLARVFTGWDASASGTDPSYLRKPLAFKASSHSPETKSFLGVNLPSGTDGVGELKTTLDTLFNHPNVGPFFGRQMIQRLVTSNPSPAYVARVATAFNNNGSGVRGDLKAVIKAILLDAEARTPTASTTQGKLREPLVRFVQWARAFGAKSPTELWNIGSTTSTSTRLGQSPLRAPSVFNFFRPGYTPAGTALANQNLVAPELQITNESTVVGYVNFMQTVLASGVGEVKADYTPWLPQAPDAAALFDALNTLLAAGQLGATTRTTVVAAIGKMTASTPANLTSRIQACAWLIMCSPEYLVQK